MTSQGLIEFCLPANVIVAGGAGNRSYNVLNARTSGGLSGMLNPSDANALITRIICTGRGEGGGSSNVPE